MTIGENPSAERVADSRHADLDHQGSADAITVIRGADEPLPRSVVRAMSFGHGGMSVLINLLGLILVFFYLPPSNAGLPQLVSDRTFLYVLNAIVLLAALGRLTDAITDPLIAVWSDKSTHRKGRRIPFMAWGALPAGLATFGLFVPPVADTSGWNIVWLVCVQALLYVALTAYVTPAFSLVADLGHTAEERLDLATWTSVAWAVGIVVAATTPFVAGLFESAGYTTLRSWQAAAGVICIIGVLAMYVPVRFIDEPRWARSQPAAIPPRQVISIIAQNRFFRFYAAAEFAYFGGLMIVQTGMLYYVTVLLELDSDLAAPLTLIMIVVATALYPFVNRTAKRHSGKRMVIGAFAISAFDFAIITFLGKLPLPNLAQAVLVVVIFAVGFAALSILPQWILSDIAEHSTLTTDTATAASFFAARTFLQKISQTFAVIVFALFTAFGRDVGDDLGIRLSGIAGMLLYATAALLFMQYNERELKSELAELSPAVESG